jgi:hypothetical protein
VTQVRQGDLLSNPREFFHMSCGEAVEKGRRYRANQRHQRPASSSEVLRQASIRPSVAAYDIAAVRSAGSNVSRIRPKTRAGSTAHLPRSARTRIRRQAAPETRPPQAPHPQVPRRWRPDETKDDPRYMTLARDGARPHVHSFHGRTLGAAAVYVFVDEVDSLHAELTSNGVSVSGPPIDQTWGTREIVVRDADRNVVTFGHARSRQ